MKKLHIIKLGLALLLLLSPFLMQAQAPQMFNYQGVARNANGVPYANKNISVRLTMHEGSSAGTVPYSETRNVQTNAFGLFSIQVGSGGAVASTGAFAFILWSNGMPKYLQVEIDLLDNNGFLDMGTNQLISVPFALSAGAAIPTGVAGGDLSGTYPNPNVVKLYNRNVGNLSPASFQSLKWSTGNNRWEPMNDSLFLPYNVTTSDAAKFFAITNTNNSGFAIKGTLTSSLSNKGAVTGFNNSAVGGVAVYGEATGGIASIGVKGVNYESALYNDTVGAVTGINYSFGRGVYGKSTNGFGVWGVTNGSDFTAGVAGENEGEGNGVTGIGGTQGAGINGIGYHLTGNAAKFYQQNDNCTHDAVLVTNNGLGAALNLNNSNDANNVTMVRVTNSGTADFMVLEAGNGDNKIRFSNAGKGFFDGGFQTGGADMAEAFDVQGMISEYEPGDVLAISLSKDRTVEKSALPYSTLVVGVYATKPGMLMSEENISTDISDKVPMGVLGVIPTKVCLEGGDIHRGDLLVTSSIPGVAMKADISKLKPGQTIGKALENYSAVVTGKIRVLVNVK